MKRLNAKWNPRTRHSNNLKNGRKITDFEIMDKEAVEAVWNDTKSERKVFIWLISEVE